jgi:hypothetical protein
MQQRICLILLQLSKATLIVPGDVRIGSVAAVGVAPCFGSV